MAATKKLYCNECKCSTVHKKEHTSHILHLIMTVLIFPWVIIWTIRYFMKGWECTGCQTVQKL